MLPFLSVPHSICSSELYERPYFHLFFLRTGAPKRSFTPVFSAEQRGFSTSDKKEKRHLWLCVSWSPCCKSRNKFSSAMYSLIIFTDDALYFVCKTKELSLKENILHAPYKGARYKCTKMCSNGKYYQLIILFHFNYKE